MIDDLRRLVFLHASRTGGTSVESALFHGRGLEMCQPMKESLLYAAGLRFWGLVDGVETQHLTLEEMGGCPSHYTVFATVRHPYARAASMLSFMAPERHGSLEQMVLAKRGGPQNNWVASQTFVTRGAEVFVRLCDGESAHRVWLEEKLEGTIPHINSRPKLIINEEDRSFARRYYAEDFERFGYAQ